MLSLSLTRFDPIRNSPFLLDNLCVCHLSALPSGQQPFLRIPSQLRRSRDKQPIVDSGRRAGSRRVHTAGEIDGLLGFTAE